MGPYNMIRGAIQNQTAGEGIFVKTFMQAAGLRSGRSRLPSRDDAVTPQLQADAKKLLENARATLKN